MFLMMVVPASGYAAAGQSGWQAPMPVGWYDDAVDNKAMAINGAGEILAVMSTQREGSSFNSIASALYLPGQGWSQLSDMGGGNFIVQNLRVVADGVGNFYATYSLDVSTTESAFSAQRFNHSAGWHDDMTLQYDAGYTVSSVRLAADDNGNAIVVWVSNLQSFPYTNEVVSCSYTAATGWGSQLAVRGASPYTPESLTVSAFRNGNAAVAWVEVVDGSHNLRLSRYVPISGWTVVQTLVATISYTEIIGMGFTEAGTGLLAWSQSMNPRQVFYKSFNGTSWTGARLVGNDSLIENAQMAFNPSGQAMLVWSNGSAGGGLHYASYAPASGWTAVASGFQIEAQLEFGFTALKKTFAVIKY
jgi:hypothetical protein